jgi:tetratricopeptide (TPR) repeat protein
MLGDYEKEGETIQRAKELFPDRIWRTQEVRVSASFGKMEDVQRLVDESFAGLSKAGNPGSVAYEAVEELRVHGYMEEAQNIAERLADWATKQMPAKPSESQQRGLAARMYLAQRWDEAYALYKDLTQNYSDSRYFVSYSGRQGRAAVRRGDMGEARKISEELGLLERPYMFGSHTYQWACIASLLGEKQKAVDLLHQAMREGLAFGIYMIQEQDFLPLKDFLPFQEFIKPKG